MAYPPIRARCIGPALQLLGARPQTRHADSRAGWFEISDGVKSRQISVVTARRSPTVASREKLRVIDHMSPKQEQYKLNKVLEASACCSGK
jgi:hypothetical protein